MSSKKKPTQKKPAQKRPSKNPTDPTLLAKDVMEAFLGEPITVKKKKPSRKK